MCEGARRGLCAEVRSAGIDRRDREAGGVRPDAAGGAAGPELADRGHHRARAAPLPGRHLRLPVHVEPPALAPGRSRCRTPREVSAAPLPEHRAGPARDPTPSRQGVGRPRDRDGHPGRAHRPATAGVSRVQRRQGGARRHTARVAGCQLVTCVARAARRSLHLDRQRSAARGASPRHSHRLRGPVPPLHDQDQSAPLPRGAVASRADDALRADVCRDHRARRGRTRRSSTAGSRSGPRPGPLPDRSARRGAGANLPRLRSGGRRRHGRRLRRLPRCLPRGHRAPSRRRPRHCLSARQPRAQARLRPVPGHVSGVLGRREGGRRGGVRERRRTRASSG